MALLKFTLTMPGRNSWNGRWSGEDKEYSVVRSLGTSKHDMERAEKIAAGKSYGYNFGDGWYARVHVEIVTPAEARKARKKSAGFMGYDWMIGSILNHGEIRSS